MHPNARVYGRFTQLHRLPNPCECRSNCNNSYVDATSQRPDYAALKRFYYCPTSERQFSELIASEANCHDYLAGLRWPRGAVCPHCSYRRPGALGVGYRCRNPQCRREFQVTTGTMFERSRLTLRGWFTMIWRMVYDSKLRSASGFRREFLSHASTSTVAAWRYQGKLRKLMSQPPGKLTGNVEFRVMQLVVRGGSKLDVSVFVQRRYNRRGLIRLSGLCARCLLDRGEGCRGARGGCRAQAEWRSQIAPEHSFV